MRNTLKLGISARLILAFMLLFFSLSVSLTTKNGYAFSAPPTTESSMINPHAQPPANIIQATDWGDNFDSYATGASLHGLGGWKGWQNNPAGTAFTSNLRAFSTPNSVDIASGADLVHEYSGYTAGEWVYTAWQYIPTSFSGQSYFILLNQYDEASSTFNWSVQVYFDGTTNQVVNSGISGGTLPLMKGMWMLLEVELDLTHDTCKFYYGGQLLYSGTWTGEVSGAGIANLAAVDLFANDSTSVFYDDIYITPKPYFLYMPFILR